MMQTSISITRTLTHKMSAFGLVLGVLLPLLQSCGGASDMSGGDFNKDKVAEIAETYRQGAEAPQDVVDGTKAVRSHAQSTTFFTLSMSRDFIGSGTELSLQNQSNGIELLKIAVNPVDATTHDFTKTPDESWLLSLQPGADPLASQLQPGINKLLSVLKEPQTADSNEAITVTRQAAVEVVLEDFPVMQGSITAAGSEPTGTADGSVLQAWGSLLASPTSTANASDFLNTDLPSMVYEPNK